MLIKASIHTAAAMLGLLQASFVNGQLDQHRRLRKNAVLIKPEHAAIATPSDASLLENLIQQEDQDAWDRMLFGSMSFSLSMSMENTCAPPGVAEFQIDEDVNIGDTLLHPGPGFTERCGPDCYTVMDSGDDPDYDPELGDTLRFAYRSVTSFKFRIRSRVCGVDCGFSEQGFCGRIGLMVRESLDPFSKNIFAAHEPENQAIWWYRTENGDYGDEPVFGMDGSPDVTCLWITLERDGDQFTFSYDYEGEDECELCQCLDLSQTVTIDMPETVLVGLGVSSPAIEGYRWYTKANFRDIEFQS